MSLWLRVGLIFLIIVSAPVVQAQKDPLACQITPRSNKEKTTRREWLEQAAAHCNVTFSYNASQLDVESSTLLPSKTCSLRELLDLLFEEYELEYIPLAAGKLLLKNNGLRNREVTLSGRVYDQNTGEPLYGALVNEKNSGISVLTNESGYFIMKIPKGQYILAAKYISYKPRQLSFDGTPAAIIEFPLVSDNLIDTIIIDNPTERIQLKDGGNILDVFKSAAYLSVTGDRDIIQNTRIIPGVQAGGEGLSGLYVRGGTPDQNLVLMDGIALYETSHVAGLSSIFMEENIREASFVKNGFPARYGGRLSGVLDIHLKEGNKNKSYSLFSAGIAGAKVHLEGPLIKNKTTYMLSGRTSWLNFYINNLLRKYTRFDDINVAYSDVYGKLTHYFSPSSTLSFTAYRGSDRFKLSKTNVIPQEDYTLSVFDRNGLNWKNEMATLKWNLLANDRLAVKIQTGILRYSNGSRSSYRFDTVAPDSTKTDELDVITRSNITDINARAEAEYYLDDRHVFRGGIQWLGQKFNPTVKQSTVILEGNAENIIDRDSLIRAEQWQIYAEDNFKLNTSLFFYAGLHLSVFNTENKTYSSLQSRLKFIWAPWERHMFTASYARMSQFIHLLSNTGLGLPSSLWVPSTDKIRPESADQMSAGYTFNLTSSLYSYAGVYTKSFQNTLEYTSPIELFYFLISDQNIVPVFNTSRDWERNVLSGKGESKGAEFLVHKHEGTIRGWISATLSRTTRTFSGLNSGQAFPAGHDKTINFHSGLSWHPGKKFHAGINFVYTTGNAFSLATEEYDSALGIRLLRASGRNNYRLPDFHQLSLNAGYLIKGTKMNSRIDLNIYNVYNRLNAYYIYIYENPIYPFNRYLRKVSILPFTPSLTFSVEF